MARTISGTRFGAALLVGTALAAFAPARGQVDAPPAAQAPATLPALALPVLGESRDRGVKVSLELASLDTSVAEPRGVPDLRARGPEGRRVPTELDSPRRATLGRGRPEALRWGWEDTALQAALGVGMLGDYLQTRHITARGHEANPIMGRHGERVSPSVYFPAAYALSTALVAELPREWRRLVQGTLIGLECAIVYRNHKAGNPF